MEFDTNTIEGARKGCRIVFEKNHFLFSALSRGIFNSLQDAQETVGNALRSGGRIFPRLPEKDPPNRFYCIVESGGDTIEVPFQVKRSKEGIFVFIVKTAYRITKTKMAWREKCLNI